MFWTIIWVSGLIGFARAGLRGLILGVGLGVAITLVWGEVHYVRSRPNRPETDDEFAYPEEDIDETSAASHAKDAPVASSSVGKETTAEPDDDVIFYASRTGGPSSDIVVEIVDEPEAEASAIAETHADETAFGGGTDQARWVPADAPPLPWNVTTADIQMLFTLSNVIVNHGLRTRVVDSQGIYGDQLELVVVPQTDRDPMAILSRLWDPGRKRLVSYVAFAEAPDATVVSYLEDEGFFPIGSPTDRGPGAGTMFVRAR